jgi:TonB family protein
MQQAAAPDIRQKLMEVGSFEARDVKDARLGGDRSAAAVTPSGFESSQALTNRPGANRAVAAGGFGSATATQAAAAPRTAVRSAGFADQQPPPPAARQQAAATQQVTPVEVLFKPTPGYSEEARTLKIQGEVTLEVEFTAAGQLRVRRIVRSLGHGLDEMAIRAAEQIRFKPAQSGGKPIDFTANVQIVFRLT